MKNLQKYVREREPQAVYKALSEKYPNATKLDKVARAIALAYPDQLEWSIGTPWIKLILEEGIALLRANEK